MKKTLVSVAIFLGIVLIAPAIFYVSIPGLWKSPQPTDASTTLSVEIADTPETMTRGLSGRVRLAEGTGMLFVLPEESFAAFWMKDMTFSIDIVWINSEKKIIHIEPGVSPETFPKSFSAEQKALYVLELPAGFAQKINLRVGDSVRF
jgi:uncharacterized membrane protein (UPF0127 family)